MEPVTLMLLFAPHINRRTLPAEAQSLPVDTLYYMLSADNRLNEEVQALRTDLLRSMNSTWLAYSLLAVPCASGSPYAGCLVCRTLPANDNELVALLSVQLRRGKVLRAAGMLAAEVQRLNRQAVSRRLSGGVPTPLCEERTMEPGLCADACPPVQELFSEEAPRRHKMAGSALGRMAERRMAPAAAEPMKPAAGTTDDDTLRLLAIRIRDEIAELQRRNGLHVLFSELGDDFLSSLGRLTANAPAPLRIDDRFRFLLTTEVPNEAAVLPAGETEVEMPTLSKVVYLLFLRHPEGIRLKEIADYRDELRTLYLTLSPRSDAEAMHNSIADLTNPASGSLNQKLSRITAAFRRLLPTDMAQHYIITGPRGEARRIILDRSLVCLPPELQQL
ncbi:MAG: hypothetical protein IJ169_04175 [Paludibacteraceae bacterium]|nr:hypothetical protein [Paludibacteraceae bacterium]